MPGLIGMVQLQDGRPLDPTRSARLLDAMAERLQHTGKEKMDTWIDPMGGVAVSRVGLDRLMPIPWPAGSSDSAPRSTAMPHTAPTAFFDGMLHEGILRPADALREAATDAELARRMEGFWAAVTYRPGPQRRISLIADRRASRPLIWTVIDEVLYFAPEVKALLAVPGFDKTLDPGALGMFFASGFLLATHTFFSRTHRLEGGTLLSVVDGQVEVERYADYSFSVEGDGTSYEEIRRQLGEQIRRSVLRNYTDPEHDLVFLSGGKDSRLILASALSSVDDPSRVRAVSWTSNRPEPGSDVYIARQIADRFGIDFYQLERTADAYASKSIRLTYILDGLTDIGAYHGDELRLMEDLAASGVRKVLRGDQCFTRGRAMLDASYAILRMCIRSTSALSDGASSWQPQAYRQISAGSDSMIAALGDEYRDIQEDNTGDQVYFRHRLQGYLNSAVYFKTLMLDHRNPLLDEGMLQLVQRLSIAARREQRVLNEGGSEAFPEVWGCFPFAERSNLEPFTDLLAQDTPVRRAALRQLEDRDSGAWEWLDRQGLLDRLHGLATSGGSRSLKSRLKNALKTSVSRAVYDVPALDVRIRRRYLARATRDDEVLLRALVLKQVFDLFVDGDGSRETYENYQARFGD